MNKQQSYYWLVVLVCVTVCLHGYSSPSFAANQFEWLKELKLPTISNILISPSLSLPRPPEGAITPFATLFIHGNRFGVYKRFKSPGGKGIAGTGRVTLQLEVPMAKHFRVAIKGKEQEFFLGSKPGTLKIDLEVLEWNPERITVKIPLVVGVPDHSAVLQVLTYRGTPSPARKVPFHATRAVTGLEPRENVTEIICSKAGDRNNCKGDPEDATGEFGCFTDIWTGGHLKIDKTISAYHVNCDRIIDWDEGVDSYLIELENGWVIKEVTWRARVSSTSEKVFLPRKKNVNLPDNEVLTKKHQGRTRTTIRVPWEVSPGPDWLSYWIQVNVEGPAGTLFGDRVWWGPK